MAHGVLALIVPSVFQIIFVHLGRTFDDFIINEGHQINTLPSCISVIAVTNLRITAEEARDRGNANW